MINEKIVNVDYRKPPLKKAFLRSQIVSLTATAVDFTVSVIFYEWLNIYYVTATSIGSCCGAVCSFILGRNWAFLNRNGHIRKQFLRFLIINGFSIFANTTGVFLFKENFDIPFIFSRIIVSVLIGVFFNFLMNRYFVFK